MIQIKNINLSFGSKKIFDDLSFNIDYSEKVGLVGLNGCGKTTFLKAIKDPSILDSGIISIQNGKKIAYMPQEVVLKSELSVFEETFSTFSEIKKIEDEIKKIEEEIEKLELLNLEKSNDLIENYANLQERLISFEPEILKAKTKKILSGLGFSEKNFNEQTENFSVGWKMRIVLAKLLLLEADFYLFDEPTNHLDIFAKEWFLDFLKSADFGFLIICHERYFLDELCEKIIEFEYGNANIYRGNYSNFVVRKEEDLKILESKFIQQKKEIDQKKKTIEKFRASATKSRMAKSMEKALDKVEVITMPPKPKQIKFNFPPVQESGKIVLKVSNLSKKFDNKTIFKNISFEIQKKQKVAVLAANGVGKSTLFNTIIGLLSPDAGTIEFGYNVNSSIFAQDQNKVLNLNSSIIDNINNLCPNVIEQKVRSFLGAFLFSGNDAYKKVSVLSGGEKNKVGIVSVLLKNSNFLLLDEPTNHLDIPSKETLLEALKEFNGTILFISHDRDFVNELATDIIELTPEKAYFYNGNYDEYIYHKSAFENHNNIDSNKNENKKKSSDNLNKSSNSNKSNDIENKIKKLEKQVSDFWITNSELEYGTKEFKNALKEFENLENELNQNKKKLEEII